MPAGGGDIVLTADVCARAIIAAAQALGVDPLAAFRAAQKDRKRLAITAAAGGVNRALDAPLGQVERVFGVRRQTIHNARCNKPHYPAIELAAMRAAEFAAWQPEAAESAVGADEPDEVAGNPEADALLAAEPLRIPVEFDEPQLPQEPPRGVHRPGGLITSTLRPAMPPPARVPAADRPVHDLVLEALAAGPLSSMSIASVIDRKEMPVSSALAHLATEGLVVSEPAECGPRKLQWRLAASVEGGAT